jgi:hypothetical protein
MDLFALKNLGAFVSSVPVKRTVTWARKDDEGVDQTTTFDIHVKRIAFGDIERIYHDKEDAERSRTAALIAASILFGEQADQPISYEDAYQLAPSLAHVLNTAIAEVNGTKRKN